MQKLIHHIVIGYLALLILIRMFAMPVACMEYAFNKEYIAATLCENKATPQMQCNGQCHLKKQLEKTNDAPGAADQKGTSKTVSVDFFQEMNTYSLAAATILTKSYNTFREISIPAGFYGNIFHPPVFAA